MASNFSRAMAAAREYAQPRSAGARRIQLANEIDIIIGVVMWDGRRQRISWPREIAEAAGEPERHLVEAR